MTPEIALVSSSMTEKKPKKYIVVAIETFTHRTTYEVGADVASSPEEAERLCKSGSVAYDDQEILEGDDVWLETESVEAV